YRNVTGVQTCALPILADNCLMEDTAKSAASSSDRVLFVKILPTSAKRSIQASLLNSNTAGSNIALENPCGTSNKAPIGRDNPCTKQTDAFPKAIPACKEPRESCSRAFM